MNTKLRQVPPVVIDVILEGIRYQGDLHKDLVVADGDLNVHLDECSARYAYWSMLHSLAIKVHKTEVNNLKVWMARKKKEAVEFAKKALGSETAKEDEVLTQNAEEYAKMNKAVIDAEYYANVLDTVARAWEMKSHMLVALGSNYRQEMVTGLTIKNWNSQFNSKK